MILRSPFRKKRENVTSVTPNDLTSLTGALLRGRVEPQPKPRAIDVLKVCTAHGDSMKNIGYQNGLLAGYSCLNNEISPLIHKLPAEHQDQFLAAVNRALRIRAELFEAKEPTR